MRKKPTAKEMLDFLERERCGVTCWDVSTAPSPENNGWTIGGAEECGDFEPQGQSLRDAIAWAMKLHAQGKWKSRTDELREEGV